MPNITPQRHLGMKNWPAVTLSCKPSPVAIFQEICSPPRVGRFDFKKFCLVFAPGVSIILFCIKKDLEEISDL